MLKRQSLLGKVFEAMLKDMTEGSPAKLMISFTLPMFLGNVFQQLYNVADTIIVGRFVGRNALAAVGSCFAIMVLLNSIINGLAMGAAVLFSQLFGAKEFKRLKTAIFMATVFILLFTLALSLLVFNGTELIISLYKMPVDTVDFAFDYLRLIFAGMIFVALYSLAAALLRSLGDSKTPLYFLIVASVINIALDLILVLVFDLEVLGVAIATVIAQAVSGLAACLYALKRIKFLKFERKDLHFEASLFATMNKYAFLTALQQSVMNFGIVMIQGLVNTFGPILMAAFSAGVKVDAFAYMPTQDFGNAFATYTAQNMGAGKVNRVEQGLKAATIITGLFSIVVSLLVILLAPQLIGLFVKANDLEVITIGVQYLRIEGAFYIFIGFLFMFYGFYRGLGRGDISIVLTIISLGTRVLLAYLLAPKYGYHMIFWSIPIGWILANITGLAAWRRLKKRNLLYLSI